MTTFKPLAVSLLWLFYFWLVVSFVFSGWKAVARNCGNTYYIDYVVFTDAFCEVPHTTGGDE
jgi:hypothetical protein